MSIGLNNFWRSQFQKESKKTRLTRMNKQIIINENFEKLENGTYKIFF